MSIVETLDNRIRQAAERLVAYREENQNLRQEAEKWRQEALKLRGLADQNSAMLHDFDRLRARKDLVARKIEKVISKLADMEKPS